MASRGLGSLTGSGVYVIEHVASGRRYVGSAVNVAKRWKEHRRQLAQGRHHSRHLQRAWDKHGELAFAFHAVAWCQREHLIACEQMLIDGLRPAFNCSPTAGSQLGFRHRPETRRKMAEAAKRTRNFTGHQHSEETKRRISEKKRGRKLGPYSADRVSRTAAAMRAGRGALTEESVRLIRQMHQQGKSHREAADAVGCSYWAVADVARNRTFKWVV